MRFWIKVMTAVGILLLVGGVARLLLPGSNSYDAGETVGMLLVSALLVACGVYLLQFKKLDARDTTGQAEDQPKSKATGIPMWAVLAMLLSGIGSAVSGQGALSFLIAFAIFSLVFWLIERGLKAVWRRLKRGQSAP